MNQNLLGGALAVVSALGFSTLAVFGRLGQRLEFPWQALNMWRFGLAALILLVLGFGRQVAPNQRRAALLLGIWYASNTSLYFAALERITAPTAALLVYLAPASVIVIRWAMGVRPDARQLAALALVMVGLVVVVGLPSPGDANAVGLLLAGLAGLFYGAYLVFSERFLSGSAPFAVASFLNLGTSATFFGFSLVSSTTRVPSSLEQWGLVIGIALFATLIALGALLAAINRIGAAKASIISSLEPVFAALLVAALFGETIVWTTAVGGGLILAGAVLAQLRNRVEIGEEREKRKEERQTP